MEREGLGRSKHKSRGGTRTGSVGGEYRPLPASSDSQPSRETSKKHEELHKAPKLDRRFLASKDARFKIEGTRSTHQGKKKKVQPHAGKLDTRGDPTAKAEPDAAVSALDDRFLPLLTDPRFSTSGIDAEGKAELCLRRGKGGKRQKDGKGPTAEGPPRELRAPPQGGKTDECASYKSCSSEADASETSDSDCTSRGGDDKEECRGSEVWESSADVEMASTVSHFCFGGVVVAFACDLLKVASFSGRSYTGCVI